MKLPIRLLTLLAAAAPVFAAEFHVAATGGDDTSNGSAAKPLKTNLLSNRANLAVFDQSPLPSFGAGNVYAKGAQAPKFDTTSLVKTDHDPKLKLTKKDDGWYLELAEDSAWKGAQPRKLVTTQLLGLAKIPNLPYENADGSPLAVDTDYFGQKRDTANPFPGPFEAPVNGEIKVWPK